MVLSEEEKFLKTLTSGEEILRTMMEGKKSLTGRRSLQALRHLWLPERPHQRNRGGRRRFGRHGWLRERDGKAARTRSQCPWRDRKPSISKARILMAFKTPSEFTYDQEVVKPKSPASSSMASPFPRSMRKAKRLSTRRLSMPKWAAKSPIAAASKTRISKPMSVGSARPRMANISTNSK
jgi:hypothetical protein